MTTKTCEICGKEIDTRGMTGHMKTHNKKPVSEEVETQETEGEISYPVQEEVEVKPVKTSKKKPVKTSKKKPVKTIPNPALESRPVTKKQWGGFFV